MNQNSRKFIESPIFNLFVIIFSIIACEILIMIFISHLPSLGILAELLIDSFLLVISLLPVLYFSSFRPLSKSIKKYRLEHKEILILYSAVESSGEAIFVTDLNGLITYVNPEFTRLYGFSAAEVIGKCTPRILKSGLMNPENYEYFWATILNKEVVRSEHINKTKDGRFLTVEGSANPIFNSQKEIIGFIGIQHDITSRKQTEEKLGKEQFLFNTLLNNLPDHIYFKDTESRFIRVNVSHAESLGLTDPDQALEKTDFDFHSAEHAKQAYNDEKTIIQTGQPLSREERIDRADGTDSWVYATKLPLRDNEGKIIGTFGISRDITKRKQAEEALRHSEERFRSIAQSANSAIISVNSNEKIMGWNRGAEDTFGYSESEILGQSLNLIIPDYYLKWHKKGWNSLKMGGEKHVIGKTNEWAGLNKNGNIFPLELSLSQWETSEGKFFTGIGRDISNRKRTELENLINYEISQGITTTSNLDELLKLIHGSLRKVVYAENCFVALIDQETGLFSFPFFVDKVNQVPLPASLGKSCSAYVFRTVKPLLLTKKIFKLLKEQNDVELAGSPSPSWIGIPLQTPSKVIGVLVLQHYEMENVYSESDVKFLNSIGSRIAASIERKKSEEEVKLKNELLQSINAEKDKFFSIIAHDLRGPLSAFIVATQIITEEIQSMNIEEIKDITLRMKTSASNIFSLLENLLEWSRQRRGVMDFVVERLNLKEKIGDCIDVLSESAREKRIDITFSIPDEMEIFADKHMFDTIIRNLLSNAIKFTRMGGNISVTAVYTNDHSIEVRVRDSGIGMTPELKNKLFLISEKTSRPGTEGEMSSGIGLLLVKEFIEKHGGKIWVESEVGKGSTFSFTIKQR